MSKKLIFYHKLEPKNKKIFSEGGVRLREQNQKAKKPLFSIITVVFNNEKYLEETIKSVLNQSYKNFEYIIIDGGSSDKTLDIINKYKDKIEYWVSEKDKGIYDAFNKGMSLCKGDFIGIINSDDIYTKNSLKVIASYIKKNTSLDFIFGSVRKHWGILHGYKPNKIFYSWGFYSSHSTGFFIKRSSAKKVGLYNLKYKYHADYDYFYRLIVHNKMMGKGTKKKEITGIFRRGGFSSTINYRKLFKEEMLIRFNHKQNFVLLIIIFIYKVIKNFKKVINS